MRLVCVSLAPPCVAAWIHALVEVQRASAAHSQATLLRYFFAFASTGTVDAAADDAAGGDGEAAAAAGPGAAPGLRDPAALAAVRRLALLYGLSELEGSLGDFLEDAYLSPAQAGWVREAVRALLEGHLWGDAVALCDAWDLADRQLRSTLGRADGLWAGAVLDMAKRSTLNGHLPPEEYRHLLRPLDTARARL